MQSLPFDKPGRFWRGNLHTHTTRSDGGKDVADVVALYRRHGYDFVAITDHFMERYGFPIVDTTMFRDHAFTTIPGAELHAPALAHGEPWHLLAVGLPPDFAPLSEDEQGPDLARRAVDAGAFLAVAHPSWYSLSLEDALSIDSAHAIEVYNHTAHHHNDRGDSWGLCEQILMQGRRVHAIACDDAHFSTRPDFLGGWVQVKARSLDPASLIEALKAGHFYSSQGPQIFDIVIDGDRLTVSASPAQAIYLTGGGSRSLRERKDHGMDATFSLEHFWGSYCRVTVVDDWGRRAWSNPIWLDHRT